MGCLAFTIGAIVFTVLALVGQTGYALLFGGISTLFSVFVINKIEERRASSTARRPHPPSRTNSSIPTNTRKQQYSAVIRFEDIREQTQSGAEQKADIEGVCDAYTGEQLEASKGVWQCPKCKVCYHSDTIEFLKKENGGRCVNYHYCNSTQFVPILGRSTQVKTQNYSPSVVTLQDYHRYIGQVVTFQGYVTRINISRSGKSVALMFENTTWTKGLKVVILRQNIDDAGGRTYLRSLYRKVIRVRGLLEQHPLFGFEIIVTRKSMISEVE
jgi:hypothetical protein